MPKLNLLGETYGQLTVIAEAPNIKDRTAWVCQCSCGNKITVITKSLRSGNTQSCGCLHKKSVSKDISNQRFGRLIALHPTEKRGGGSVMWECLCDCGKYCYVAQSSLVRYHTQSCGCLQKERASIVNFKDLTNQKFNKLLALYPLHEQRSLNGHIIWCCKCDCGNYVDVISSSLIRGHTQSCGCIKSKGEALVKSILDENNIIYIKEKAFQDCRFSDTNGLARFDFYLPDYNTIIEFDGEQHFHQTSFYTIEEFNLIQKRDIEKTNYCKNHNIKLIRIPYYDYNKINLEYIKERIENV